MRKEGADFLPWFMGVCDVCRKYVETGIGKKKHGYLHQWRTISGYVLKTAFGASTKEAADILEMTDSAVVERLIRLGEKAKKYPNLAVNLSHLCALCEKAMGGAEVDCDEVYYTFLTVAVLNAGERGRKRFIDEVAGEL